MLEPYDGQVGPPRLAPRTVARERPTSYQYLLDLDLDLAEELDLRMRLVARTAASAITVEVEMGDVPLSDWLAKTAPGPGVLVLEGVLAVELRVGDRTAAELAGAGDLLQAWTHEDEDLLACEIGWRALVPARFAMLDAGFVERVRPWPEITQVLLRRAGRRARNLNVQRAIAAQPRLEVRLALLLWHLAARWGKVEPGGIRLPVPLTHQLLGRLVGAERPSVSHALGRLAAAGLVRGHGDEWHLFGSLQDQLASMHEPVAGRVEELVAATRRKT